MEVAAEIFVKLAGGTKLTQTELVRTKLFTELLAELLTELLVEILAELLAKILTELLIEILEAEASLVVYYLGSSVS